MAENLLEIKSNTNARLTRIQTYEGLAMIDALTYAAVQYICGEDIPHVTIPLYTPQGDTKFRACACRLFT